MQPERARRVLAMQLRVCGLAENRDSNVALACFASVYVRAMTTRVDWNRWCRAAGTMSLRSVLLVAVIPSLAAAQPSAAPPAPDIGPVAPAAPPDDPSVAITVSPIHLAVPMAELTAEIRVAPKVG